MVENYSFNKNKTRWEFMIDHKIWLMNQTFHVHLILSLSDSGLRFALLRIFILNLFNDIATHPEYWSSVSRVN